MQRLGALARQYGMRIVASYPVRGDDGTLYIAASVFSPRGALELTYHKTHPWAASDFENAHFALGSAFAPSVPLLSFPHVPDPTEGRGRAASPLPTSHAFDDAWLNVLVCWDLEFPEPARCVRLATPGAHHASPLVLCVPTANADAFVAAHTLRTRAVENHVFLLCANNAGPGFCGDSCVIGPDGAVLVSAPDVEEGMFVAEIDLGADAYVAARKVNPMLEWRRPELYASIGEEERWEKPSQRPGGF
jgi:predicted amidohydrolase